jgi:ribosomal protein uL22
MGTDKLEARQEKAKEMFEEKARQKKEDEVAESGAVKEEKKEEKPKPKKKIDVKKPVVTEAVGRGEYMPISMKESVEIARAIRGKSVKQANQILEYVLKLERPIRYFRYNRKIPHRKGTGFGSGRYPVKTTKFIKGVLLNAVANAKYLNLNEDDLYIKAIIVNRAIPKERQGRYTHVNITVAEQKEKAKTKKTAGHAAKYNKKVNK